MDCLASQQQRPLHLIPTDRCLREIGRSCWLRATGTQDLIRSDDLLAQVVSFCGHERHTQTSEQRDEGLDDAIGACPRVGIGRLDLAECGSDNEQPVCVPASRSSTSTNCYEPEQLARTRPI
jgi:hypothetical protein